MGLVSDQADGGLKPCFGKCRENAMHASAFLKSS